MSKPTRSRRDVICALAAGAAAGAVHPIFAQVSTQPTSIPSEAPAQTQPATAPATQPGAITVADVASADKIAARHYSSDDQRSLMLKNLETYRKRLRGYREQNIDPTVEPAIHFDPRLPDTKLPHGHSSCTLSDGPLPAFNGDIESLAFTSVADLSRLIKSRTITSTQLTKMYLDRLKRFDPKLLCVVTLTEQLALVQAARADEEIAAGNYRGPLHGIPYGAKDLLATKNIPTTYGVSVYQDQVFDFDATVIAKLEAAGAVLLAKLSLGELAMGDVWFGGKTRNPWDPTRGSSGSSAGPAAAVAAGLVGFSIGSETLGSIISPCVETGVTGLRPTWGRISRFGALPLTWTLDKLGPICRSVEDCALLLHALHGPDPRDPTAADVPFVWDPELDLKSLRVGYDPRAFDFDNPDVFKDESLKQIYRPAFEMVRSLADAMKPITLPDASSYSGVIGTIIACESSSAFGDLLTSGQINQLVQQHEGAWPNTFRVGATVPAADYLRVQRLRSRLMREMHDALRDVDCYVTVPYSGPTLAFTNLTGHPSLITRCGMHEGRPRMIEFIGNLYREDAITRLAFAYERSTPWHRHVPEMNP